MVDPLRREGTVNAPEPPTEDEPEPTAEATASDRQGDSLPARRARRLRPWHLSWLIAAPIAAALVWILVTGPIGPSSSSGPGGGPGATFYVLGAETEGLQVGQLAPDFVGTSDGKEVRLTDLDGRPIRIDEFRGRPLWINFWATWCPPCQQETPDLRAAYEANRADGLALLGISVQEPVADVRSFVERYGLTYDIGLDSTGAVFGTYSVFGLPTHYFVDRDGVIRDRYFGPLTRQQMDEKIALISGQ